MEEQGDHSLELQKHAKERRLNKELKTMNRWDKVQETWLNGKQNMNQCHCLRHSVGQNNLICSTEVTEIYLWHDLNTNNQ